MIRAQILTIRAIGSEFLRRKLRAATIASLLVGLVGLGIVIYLSATFSAWYLLLLAIVIPILIIPVLLWLINKLFIALMRPQMTDSQLSLLATFVDKLERVAEHAQTPVIVMIFRVVRDMIFVKENGYIEQVSNDTATLQPDFDALQKSFVK